MDGDIVTSQTDFTAGSFHSRREPMRDLITTFSDLYINSDEESERAEDNDPDEELHFPPPPPPLTGEYDGQSSAVNPMLNTRVTSLEAQLRELENGVSEKVSLVELEKQ